MQFKIIARVDDDSKIFSDNAMESIRQLRAAHSTGNCNDIHPR